jgi:hypothetical protein
MTTVIYPSTAFLNSLYSSLCSTLYSGGNNIQASVQSFTIYYLNKITAENYTSMVNSINYWITSKTIPQIATGLPTGKPANEQIYGLRVQVLEADGTTVYDSNSNSNIFSNIGIPKPDFITSGKYLINENQGSRSYFQGALLSQSGNYTMKKYSNSVGLNQLYLAVRQGLSPSEPFGVIVISINAALE